jgi:predicted transposase/invertase (TIGR01784 family)
MRKQKRQLPPKPTIGTFIDPLTDFGFKRIFGSEPSKELLINFLNELFSGKKIITDLVYNNNEHSGPISDSRKMIYDLTCTGQDGEQFIIEVQRIRQKFFKDRSVYYTSRLIHDQEPKGKKEWNYLLKEVYFIGLMDSVLDDSDKNEYVHPVSLIYEKTGNQFYNKLGFIFIEVPKFKKSENELKTGIDKWLFILKNLSQMQKIPVILNTRIFTRLFNIAAVANLTKEDFMKYEKDLMASWDEYAIKETLIEEGMEKGIEKGIEKIVRNLLLSGKLSVDQISDLAGVPHAYVERLERRINKK